MNAIELRNVLKTYEGRRVVDTISASVARSERVVLFGPSGSGKTTVLRLVAGLEVPDSGVISIDGAEVAVRGRNLIEPERRRIGMVFQDLALWPNMTAFQHLEFALRYDRLSQRTDSTGRIWQVLEMVRMADRAHAKPAELSGGQQQRIALARALVSNPAIVLMDEPLSSLDHELSLHLRGEILRLHAALGFTLIYVTHNREEAVDIGSRVIAMRDGRITSA
jgi:iron(III) transport system ATP-binding protein